MLFRVLFIRFLIPYRIVSITLALPGIVILFLIWLNIHNQTSYNLLVILNTCFFVPIILLFVVLIWAFMPFRVTGVNIILRSKDKLFLYNFHKLIYLCRISEINYLYSRNNDYTAIIRKDSCNAAMNEIFLTSYYLPGSFDKLISRKKRKKCR